jgi:hypothetical protein
LVGLDAFLPFDPLADLPFDPLADDSLFPVADSLFPVAEDSVFPVVVVSALGLAAGFGRLDFPLVDVDAPGLADPPVLAELELAPALGLGRARSVRSTTGALGFFVSVAVTSSVGGGGGPPTMPRRNRISCVRIRIALEMIK